MKKVHPIFLVLKQETGEVVFDKSIKTQKFSESPVFLQIVPNGMKRIIKKREGSINYDRIKQAIIDHYHDVFLVRNPHLAQKIEFNKNSEDWFIDFNELDNQAKTIDKKQGLYAFGQKLFFICPVALILSDTSEKYLTQHFIGWGARAAIFLYETCNEELLPEEEKIIKFQELADDSNKYERISFISWDNIISMWFYALQSLNIDEVDFYLLSQIKEEKTI